VQNALIFCNRKVEVDVLYKSLKRHGFSVGALHGDMDQPSRFATLNRFKAGETQLLVCSDVAARGLDIGGLSHVFNFDVPFHAEDYVHRIGRTGRAGREGNAYTIAVPDDARNVAAIETLTGRPIPRIEIDGLDPVSAEELAEAVARPKRGRGGHAHGGRRAARAAALRAVPAVGADRDAPSVALRPHVAAERRVAARFRRSTPRPERAAGSRAPPREPQRRWRAGGDCARRRPPSDGRASPWSAASAATGAPADDAGERRPSAGTSTTLEPSVRGFGDAVPASMLIPIPRPGGTPRPTRRTPSRRRPDASNPAKGRT
jgi:superfamily II DNA/RNA helicase